MESSGQRASYPFANITIELDGEFYEREVVVVLTQLEEVLPGVEEPLMKHITRGLRKSKQQGLLEVCKSQQQQEIKSLVVVT